MPPGHHHSASDSISKRPRKGADAHGMRDLLLPPIQGHGVVLKKAGSRRTPPGSVGPSARGDVRCVVVTCSVSHCVQAGGSGSWRPPAANTLPVAAGRSLH